MEDSDFEHGDGQCPFCGGMGYDLIGLKYHLGRSCDVFDETPHPDQVAKTVEVKRD